MFKQETIINLIFPITIAIILSITFYTIYNINKSAFSITNSIQIIEKEMSFIRQIEEHRNEYLYKSHDSIYKLEKERNETQREHLEMMKERLDRNEAISKAREAKNKELNIVNP